ncbi:MAG: hypothetical protein KC619_35705 [Myxococcales bacterium]|nr:hypothetical protein [Myxococcales bacterium]
MLRSLVFALSLALALVAAPRGVEAQARRISRSSSRHDTRGSTRRVGSRESRGSSRRRARSAPSRRTRRRTRRRWRSSYGPSDCVYVQGDWCYYDTWEGGYADPFFGLGFSLDYVGAVFPTDPNGLSSARAPGDVDAGVLTETGGGARVWLLYDRLRIGFALQGGGAWRISRAQPPSGGAIEAGSRLGDGWWLGGWGFGAYQAQLADSVALFLGARAGVHALFVALEWEGRTYDTLERVFFSAGPEVGVLLSSGAVGLMIQAFADLAQPGFAQISFAFVFEDDPHEGTIF